MNHAPLLSEQDATLGTKAAGAGETGMITLDALMSSSAATRGHDVLIRPVAGHDKLLRLGAVDAQSRRLAAFLRSVEPEKQANALIISALGEKTLIAMIACLKAGMTPCLVPVDSTADVITAHLERLEAPVAIGVGAFGQLRPLLPMREAAMRSFHLRLAAGFGPHVPDGVADIDVILAEETPIPEHNDTIQAGQIRLLSAQDKSGAGFLMTEGSLIAASLEIARELRPTPGSRLVTTMVGTDMATLASSFGLSILAGLELTPLGLFSLARLWACLSSSITTHLVVPASVEDALSQTGVTSHKALRSLVFIHEAGVHASPLRATYVDCTVLDIWRPVPGQIKMERRHR